MTDMERLGGLSWPQFFYTAGSLYWPITYRTGASDADALATIIRHQFQERVPDAIDDQEVQFLCAAAKWVDGACRTIITTDRYFSAMAATSIGPDAILDLRVPWPAFVVEVPPGLLVAPDGSEYRHIVCAQFMDLDVEQAPGSQSVYALVQIHTERHESAKVIAASRIGTLAALLAEPPRGGWGMDGDYFSRALEFEAAEDAIQDMCFRAVVGLLFTMQHTTNFRARPYPAATRGNLRSAPPPHRMVLVGSPLKLDCRQAIREAAGGRRGRGAPSVQTLVRGHIKRQVVGHGRRGRKVVWIEPYWRGPEDAPILSRPYRVGA